MKHLHYFTFVNLLVQKLLQWKDRWLFTSFLNSCEHGDKKHLVINLLLHEYKTSRLHFLCLRKSVIFIILNLNLNTWVHIWITGQSLSHWLIRWAELIRGLCWDLPVKLVAQVTFRLKFLEAFMNMSRSRFGWGQKHGQVIIISLLVSFSPRAP